MIEKDSLAIIFGVKKFRQYLAGQIFTLLTDHKPLTYILDPKRGIPALVASGLQRLSIFNWKLIYTILSIMHPSTMELLMRYHAS